MFRSVQSSVLLLCDQTSLGTYSLMFANCFVFCDVLHVRSSILGQNVMSGKFNVQTVNVQSVQSSIFWCSKTKEYQYYRKYSLINPQINYVHVTFFLAGQSLSHL